MEAPALLKQVLFPDRDGLRRLRFYEDEWLSALVPDQERFGLARELILQRVYDVAGGISGKTVVDAGANVGLFSLVASRHAERVIALEPDPINYRVLELNLHANGISNVSALNRALWTVDGPVAMDRPLHEDGRVASTASSVVTTPSSNGNHGWHIEALTLDTIVEQYGDIDLLKMDIEGAEEEVLPTTRALGRVRRIVAELHLSRDNQEQPMVSALQSAGFQVRIIPSAGLYTPNWTRSVLRNWGALKGETLIKLGLLAYLMAPLTKPRRPGRDMPLLVASR